MVDVHSSPACPSEAIVEARPRPFRRRSWVRCLGTVVVVGALATACGSGSQKLADATKTTGTSAGGGAGGKPARPGGAVGVAAPLNVPAIGGNDVASVLADATRKFKQACGGDLCVKLVVVPIADPTLPGCEEFTGDTSPPRGSQIQRGSVVKLPFDVSGCDSATPAPSTPGGVSTTRPVTNGPATTRLPPSTTS